MPIFRVEVVRVGIFRVGIVLGVSCPGGSCTGRNCLGCKFSGWELSYARNFRVVIVQGENCPVRMVRWESEWEFSGWKLSWKRIVRVGTVKGAKGLYVVPGIRPNLLSYEGRYTQSILIMLLFSENNFKLHRFLCF